MSTTATAGAVGTATAAVVRAAAGGGAEARPGEEGSTRGL